LLIILLTVLLTDLLIILRVVGKTAIF